MQGPAVTRQSSGSHPAGAGNAFLQRARQSPGSHPAVIRQSSHILSTAILSRAMPNPTKPRRPIPLPTHAVAQPIAPGAAQLHQLTQRCLQRISESEKASLRTFLLQLRTPWKVASVCSGTESQMLALQGLSSGLSSDLQVAFPAQHRFGAEINRQKRRWITSLFPGCLLFKDVRELSKGYAATDGRDGNTQAVVPSDYDMLVGGFPCTSASSTVPRQPLQIGHAYPLGPTQPVRSFGPYVRSWITTPKLAI